MENRSSKQDLLPPHLGLGCVITYGCMERAAQSSSRARFGGVYVGRVGAGGAHDDASPFYA